MEVTRIAALVYGVVTAGVVLFQIALAFGAPWGAYAMGGVHRGRLPPPMRLAALVQAGVLALLALVVLSAADIVAPELVDQWPWLPWLAVAVSAVSLVLNLASSSAGERRTWVPVAIVLLGSSVLVALTAG